MKNIKKYNEFLVESKTDDFKGMDVYEIAFTIALNAKKVNDYRTSNAIFAWLYKEQPHGLKISYKYFKAFEDEYKGMIEGEPVLYDDYDDIVENQYHGLAYIHYDKFELCIPAPLLSLKTYNAIVTISLTTSKKSYGLSMRDKTNDTDEISDNLSVKIDLNNIKDYIEDFYIPKDVLCSGWSGYDNDNYLVEGFVDYDKSINKIKKDLTKIENDNIKPYKNVIQKRYMRLKDDLKTLDFDKKCNLNDIHEILKKLNFIECERYPNVDNGYTLSVYTRDEFGYIRLDLFCDSENLNLVINKIEKFFKIKIVESSGYKKTIQIYYPFDVK